MTVLEFCELWYKFNPAGGGCRPEPVHVWLYDLEFYWCNNMANEVASNIQDYLVLSLKRDQGFFCKV